MEFFGRSTTTLALGSVASSMGLLTACSSKSKLHHENEIKNSLQGSFASSLAPNALDEVSLAPGLSASILLKWNDVINTQGHKFGTHCDFIGLIPIAGTADEFYMWINHESVHPLLASGHVAGDKELRKTIEQVRAEMLQVGGSLLRLRRANSQWEIVKNDPINRRWTANTLIPFSKNEVIMETNTSRGTLANCSGGVTPWGTFLSCEENYHHFFGEVTFDENGKRKVKKAGAEHGWDHQFPRPPEHYGWVVEINPLSGQSVKHTALGRFAHEGATVTTAKDGRAVVYMGDDIQGGCFYKFISTKVGDLSEGTLYVANLTTKQWLPLDRSLNPNLAKKFKSQLQTLIQTREAAQIVGGSRLDRPEDCEIDPLTGHIYLALTTNPQENRPFGMILRFAEKDQDPAATEFQWDTFLAGGEATGFACPDNLAFDPNGGLWMTTDISDRKLNKGEFQFHGNNSLFYIPLRGTSAGKAIRMAVAPIEAEFTGPCFSPDGRTLFLSVQHPGEGSTSMENLTSHWPEGGSSVPKSSVIAISGPLLEDLMKGSA